MDTPSPLTIGVWLVVAVLALAACARASAATHTKAPVTAVGVCDFEHRMDIQIIDGTWFECTCIALANGWDCAWQELGDAAVENRKHWARYRKPAPSRTAPAAPPKPKKTTGSSMRNSPWLAGDSWAQANL